MASYVIRRMSDVLWRKFKARADKEGVPYRWVVLNLLEQYADGTLASRATRPTSATSIAEDARQPRHPNTQKPDWTI